jgi:hypothetical protein
MFSQLIARTEMVIEPDALPRSLRAVTNARATRAKEKIGHSGRDDRGAKKDVSGRRFKFVKVSSRAKQADLFPRRG